MLLKYCQESYCLFETNTLRLHSTNVPLCLTRFPNYIFFSFSERRRAPVLIFRAVTRFGRATRKFVDRIVSRTGYSGEHDQSDNAIAIRVQRQHVEYDPGVRK